MELIFLWSMGVITNIFNLFECKEEKNETSPIKTFITLELFAAKRGKANIFCFINEQSSDFIEFSADFIQSTIDTLRSAYKQK